MRAERALGVGAGLRATAGPVAGRRPREGGDHPGGAGGLSAGGWVRSAVLRPTAAGCGRPAGRGA